MVLILIRTLLILQYLISSIMKLNCCISIKLKVMILKKCKEYLMASHLMKFSLILLLLLTIHLLNDLFTPSSEGVIIAGIFDAIFGTWMQEKTNDQNARLQRETNELNYKINQENNAFNRNLAIDMFNMENAYNDPSAQMSRMKNAGINPFVAAGNVGNVEGRADTVPAQNPIPMQAAHMEAPHANYDMTSDLVAVAQSLASLSQASKTSEETSQMRAMREDILRKMKGDADLSSAQALNAEFQNTINYLYGFKKANQEVKNLQATWANMQQDSNESEARILKMEFEKDLFAIQTKLGEADYKKFLAVEPWLQKMVQQLYSNLVAEGKEIASRTSANYASASHSSAMAGLAVSQQRFQEIVNQYAPLLQRYQVAAAKKDLEGKIISNKREVQNMIIQAKKALPEIKALYLNNSKMHHDIVYIQGLIEKLPHDIDKVDSETLKNCASSVRDLFSSIKDLSDVLIPF